MNASTEPVQFVKSGRRATDPIVKVRVATPPPEGSLMPKALAQEKKAAEKAATKKLAANGTTKPKHAPGESAPGVKGVFPASTPPKSGVDSTPAAVGQSGVSSPTTGDSTMTTETKTPATGAAGTRTDPAKIAAKEASLAKSKAESEAKKAKAAADKEAAKAEKAKAAAAAKTERDAKNAEKLAARQAAAEGTKRTYFGPMTSLADRVKQGAYVKSMTGQLRSSDDLAVALDAVPTDNVIKLGLEVLGLTTNPYAALNRGQQSMNLRNKMRGAIKANEGKGLARADGTVITLDYIKSVRDANGYATAEAAAAAKKADKEAKAKAKAEAAEAAKAKKDADAKAKAMAAVTPAQAAA